MKNDFVIVLPTHSDYIEITKIFLQLLKKNWSDCPFKIIISVTGEKIVVDDAEIVYNGKKASLIDCLVNVSKQYKNKYYISFLGDAFINERVNNEEIAQLLNELTKNDIKYCSLEYVKNYKRRKKYNEHFRYINNLDRYSHNFTAFVASYDFINNEISKYKTDLDFEKAYLFGADDYYYNDHLIVNRNYFAILPGIVKGKWDRINYRKLQRSNPEIDFEGRDVQGFKESLVCHIRSGIVSFLSPSIRRRAKKIAERIFRMKFGVDE